MKRLAFLLFLVFLITGQGFAQPEDYQDDPYASENQKDDRYDTGNNDPYGDQKDDREEDRYRDEERDRDRAEDAPNRYGNEEADPYAEDIEREPEEREYGSQEQDPYADDNQDF